MSDNDLKLVVGSQAESHVAAEATRRAQNCMIDIRNVLSRHKCIIDPRVTISGSEGVSCTFMVVPLVERPTG